ncbi:hypothetical protein GSI_10043 [Ganoderma sinense ZZ0214-1]|uniref:Uncharacterized protein n=1 Tax=Ganoderma sinense ZZ0214-1 TaxID=1077348 RepID=A0A2G8RZH6_9APHY|nr:hypothetical protein GSI_10043 [Ganoderma sinense ZZ0214-1]
MCVIVSPAFSLNVLIIFGITSVDVDGLVVFPVFDCGLASFPPVPLVEALIPDPLVFVGGDEESRVIKFTRSKINHPIPSQFRLYFSETAEFWDVMTVLSNLRSQQEKRLADMIDRLAEVRACVPTHSPNPIQDVWCSNAAHNNAESALSPTGSPALSGSPTVTGSPPAARPPTPVSI